MGEFTRDGRALEVATSLPSPRVMAVLEHLVIMYGAPQFIRRDHEPEFITLAVRGLSGAAPDSNARHRAG